MQYDGRLVCYLSMDYTRAIIREGRLTHVEVTPPGCIIERTGWLGIAAYIRRQDPYHGWPVAWGPSRDVPTSRAGVTVVSRDEFEALVAMERARREVESQRLAELANFGYPGRRDHG